MWTNNQKKSKYAIVLVASNGYLPGINGIINALDYYGNKIDLHFIHEDLPGDYLKQIKESKLNYRLILQDFPEQEELMLKDFPDVANNKFQRWSYLRYWYINKIKEEYDATANLDGDSILLNNITPWFEFVSGTDYLLSGAHECMYLDIGNWTSKNWEYQRPFYCHPIICDPKKWSNVWSCMFKRERKYRESDMVALNRCVFLLGEKERVFLLPACQWTTGYFSVTPLNKTKIGERYFLQWIPEKMQINILHRRYYNRGFREHDIEARNLTGERKKIMENNIKLIIEMYKELNEKHKIKYFHECLE